MGSGVFLVMAFVEVNEGPETGAFVLHMLHLFRALVS